MDPDLTLYDNPDSTNALKVRILLAELGQEARSIAVPLEGERHAEYLDLHPFGLISRHGTPKLEGFYILHEGMIGVTSS